jgi:hypothetical protein
MEWRRLAEGDELKEDKDKEDKKEGTGNTR